MEPELQIIHGDLHVIQQGLDGYAARWNHLRFLVSIAVEKDGKRWLHTSVSRDDHSLPTYDDLMQMKRLCVGDHRTALQVFPPKDRHVNVGKERHDIEILHLWSCLDGDVTPDFRGPGGEI